MGPAGAVAGGGYRHRHRAPTRDQPGRTATLTVQFAAVTLKPPRHRAQEPLPTLPVSGVLAREIAPPAGVKPIEWLLLTTVPVVTLAEACERIQWYSCRWVIEIYHKILKSGCRIETRQWETAARLERYLAIDSVVAWRVLGLTFQSRETPEMSGEAFLDRDDWQALACYRNPTLTPPQQPPTSSRPPAGSPSWVGSWAAKETVIPGSP